MAWMETNEGKWRWVADLDEVQSYRARGRIKTNRFDAANQADPRDTLLTLIKTLEQSCLEAYRQPSQGRQDYQTDPAIRLLTLKLMKYCHMPVDDQVWSSAKATCKARIREVT